TSGLTKLLPGFRVFSGQLTACTSEQRWCFFCWFFFVFIMVDRAGNCSVWPTHPNTHPYTPCSRHTHTDTHSHTHAHTHTHTHTHAHTHTHTHIYIYIYTKQCL